MSAREAREPEIHVATWDELDARSLYEILKLRSDVFVVEQQCAYADIDGRDIETGARHMWIDGDEGRVVSALRLLDEDGGLHRIGRVATAATHRRRGLADLLMRRAIALAGPPIVVSAQAHLEQWYAAFGFRESGARWTEDGIEHCPMRFDAG
jgi:ElaA protein